MLLSVRVSAVLRRVSGKSRLAVISGAGDRRRVTLDGSLVAEEWPEEPRNWLARAVPIRRHTGRLRNPRDGAWAAALAGRAAQHLISTRAAGNDVKDGRRPYYGVVSRHVLLRVFSGTVDANIRFDHLRSLLTTLGFACEKKSSYSRSLRSWKFSLSDRGVRWPSLVIVRYKLAKGAEDEIRDHSVLERRGRGVHRRSAGATGLRRRWRHPAGSTIRGRDRYLGVAGNGPTAWPTRPGTEGASAVRLRQEFASSEHRHARTPVPLQ